jgi:hypothetical protein
MKYFLLFLVSLAWSLPGTAQQVTAIANGGFENWAVDSANIEQPTGWLGTEKFVYGITGGNVYLGATGTVLKTADSHSGAFAIKMVTDSVRGTLMGGTIVLGSRMWPGQISFGGQPLQTGLSHPSAIEFYYKTSGVTDSTTVLQLQVFLTKRLNDSTSVRVAQANTNVGQHSATYLRVQVPLDYDSASANIIPDSIHIIAFSDNGPRRVQGTAFYLDDFAFNAVLATTAARLAANLMAFPNPSTNGLFTLRAQQQPGLLSGALTVTDLTGRVIQQEAAKTAQSLAQRSVDLRGQPAGVYLLRLASAQGTAVQRLVVQ